MFSLYTLQDIKDRIFTAENAEHGFIAETAGALQMYRLVFVHDIIYNPDGTIDFKNIVKGQYEQNQPHEWRDLYVSQPDTINIKISFTMKRKLLLEDDFENFLNHQQKLIQRILKKTLIAENQRDVSVEEEGFFASFTALSTQTYTQYKRVFIYIKLNLIANNKDVDVNELAEKHVYFTPYKHRRYRKIMVFSGTNAFTIARLIYKFPLTLKNVINNIYIKTKELGEYRTFVIHNQVEKKDLKYIT